MVGTCNKNKTQREEYNVSIKCKMIFFNIKLSNFFDETLLLLNGRYKYWDVGYF